MVFTAQPIPANVHAGPRPYARQCSSRPIPAQPMATQPIPANAYAAWPVPVQASPRQPTLAHVCEWISFVKKPDIPFFLLKHHCHIRRIFGRNLDVQNPIIFKGF